jgi:hypothetical protein
MFVRSVVTILASVFNVTVSETDEQIRELAKNAPFVVAKPGKKVIKTGDDDDAEEKGDDDDEKLNKLVRNLHF